MKKKKVWMIALLALVMVFGIAGTAIAASDQSPTSHPGCPGRGKAYPKGMGEVTAIASDQFTVETRNGTEVTVLVDDDTRYFGDLESFNDIEVGMKVAVIGAREGDLTIAAKAVGSGEFPLGKRAGGEVTAVDSDSLTIENRKDESFTFQVDGETFFLSRSGEIESLSDIEIGDFAKVHYEEASDGTLIAKSIGAGTPKEDGAKNHERGRSPQGNQSG